MIEPQLNHTFVLIKIKFHNCNTAYNYAWIATGANKFDQFDYVGNEVKSNKRNYDGGNFKNRPQHF